MLGNDIANDVPSRVLVHVSALFDRTPHFTKVMGMFPKSSTTYDIRIKDLAFFNYWRDTGLVFEAFHYANDDWPGDKLWDKLDDYHHPFNKFVEFDDTNQLSTYLAYMPDIKHVVDPLHPLRFGGKSLGEW